MRCRIIIAALLALLAGAAPLAAQDSDYCGLGASSISGNLAGTWTLHQLPGYAIGGVVPVPLATTVVDAVSLRPSGDGFDMNSPDLQGGISFEATGRLEFALPPGVPGFTDNLGNPQNFTAGVDGCAWPQMPRFYGEKNFALGGGKGMFMQLVIHFRSASYGLGMLRFSSTGKGPAFIAARPIVLSRGNS